MLKKLSFSIDKYELKEINNSQFSKLRMYICHDLDNKNTSYIDFESMQEAEATLLNKPIIMKMNRMQSDFEEHELDTIVVGFVPEIGHNIHYEVMNGRNYLVADAIIWKYYSSKTLEIFKRDKEKKISMEIQVLSEHMRDDGLVQIDKYAYLAVCLLGNKYETGMYDTTANIIDFSKSNDINTLHKEWTSFVKCDNEDAFELQNQEMEVNGMSKQNIGEVEETAKEEMSTEEVIEDENKEEMAKEVDESEKVENETEEMSEEINESENGELEPSDENKEEMAKEVDESEKVENETEEMSEDNNKSNEGDEKEEMSKEDKKEYIDFSEKLSEKENAILEMSARINDLVRSNAELTEKIEKLSAFKLEVETNEKNEQVKGIFSKLSNVLSKDEIDQWKSKVSEYDNAEIFEKEIKSFACDKILQNKDGVNKTGFSSMAINLDTISEDDKQDDSVWSRITKKVSK